MNKIFFTILLFIFSFSLQGSEGIIYFPKCSSGALRYDLKSHKKCLSKGISCTSSEPYIAANIKYKNEDGSIKEFNLNMLPLNFLLDESEKIKSIVKIKNKKNQEISFNIDHDSINYLQDLIPQLMAYFKEKPNYYLVEAKQLIELEIITQDKNGNIGHGPKGYKFPEKNSTSEKINTPDDNEVCINNQPNKEQTSYSTPFIIITGIGVLGIIGLLLWLYKKR